LIYILIDSRALQIEYGFEIVIMESVGKIIMKDGQYHVQMMTSGQICPLYCVDGAIVGQLGAYEIINGKARRQNITYSAELDIIGSYIMKGKAK
jgi:hypothetical protein